MLIQGRLTSAQTEAEDQYIYPHDKFLKKNYVLLTEAVVRPDEGKIPLRIFNIGTEPIKLYKGSVAAVCEPVTEIRELPREEAHPQTTGCPNDEHKVPVHLIELLQQSTQGLSQEQKKSVAEFLTRYADVFASLQPPPKI